MNQSHQPRALFICPDYVSHFFPMSAVAEECKARGIEVTFATGQGLQTRVTSLGFKHEELILGPGSNTAVLRPEEQPGSEADHMREFFTATRGGAVATLLYQSRAREHDMLWRPAEVYERLAQIVSIKKPDVVVVDQLAYGATLALHALQIPFVSFLPANPSSLPGPDELFGFPARLPRSIRLSDGDRDQLRLVCEETDQRFTRRFNDVLSRLSLTAPAVESAFRFTSRWLVLLNYPAELGRFRQNQLPPHAHFLGSCVRSETIDHGFDADLERLDPARATAYVSLGTFLSARDDVLGTIAKAISREGVQGIVATGSADARLTEDLPKEWIVRPIIPQISALRRSNVVVSHGGNNTVTESLTQGVPMLIGPFSSDQFDSAADVEAAQLGLSFDPNDCGVAGLAHQIRALLRDDAFLARVQAVSARMQHRPGQSIGADLLQDVRMP